MKTDMEIELEHVQNSPTPNTFRVAFHSASERWLLPYPKVTGLTFTNSSGIAASKWKSRFLVSEPLDDFVLPPGARIGFDLFANINVNTETHRWVIDLPPDKYMVHFVHHVDRETDWYDFLAKRSRFVDMTPIWRGTVQSNTIQLTVLDT